MSNRALRRLQQEADLMHGDGKENGEEDIEEEGASPPVQSKKNKKKKCHINPFELLAGDEEKVEDEENEEDREEEGIATKSSETASHSSGKKKKQKKKKKKKAEDMPPQTENEPEDEIEASVQEVNRILGEAGLTRDDIADQQQQGHFTVNMKALLNIEYKYLNADNELRRRFGSRIVQGEQGRGPRQRNRMPQRQHRLVQPKDNWHYITKTGLSMTMVEGGDGKEATFSFEHSPDYRQIQFRFLEAVESHNPQNIANLNHDYPFHIDSLIQLSEIFHINEDPQTAVDLIERALYVMEKAFHPRFNMATGNCRLDFRRQENRAMFLLLFKHLTAVGRRGCNRTSLELCKLLLSLDPDGDPLCVLLMIDYYALCCGEHAFLVRLFEEWESFRNLSQLPNFAFSVPLALFHQSKDNPALAHRADAMLQESLLMFPGLLPTLLDKCGVSADRQVTDHAFFSAGAHLNQTKALQQLVSLYVGRCHSLWKDAAVMGWLETVVKSTLTLVDAKDPRLVSFAEKRKVRYQGTPRNIYRHLIISNIPDATATLPPEMTNTPVLTYDPLPPLDAIVSYSPPERPRTNAADGENVLSLFLRSLLPNYNANAQPGEAGAGNNNNNNNAAEGGGGGGGEGEDGEEEGAAGGAGNQEVRRGRMTMSGIKRPFLC